MDVGFGLMGAQSGRLVTARDQDIRDGEMIVGTEPEDVGVELDQSEVAPW
jgi:hypothetical protein